MRPVLAFLVLAAASTPLSAQEQQAGNEASTNAEQTFQELIAKCDDTDALMLRARIRLQLGRTTDEARDEAQALLDQGFSECGAGDMASAMTSLEKSLDVAEAGVDETFSQPATVEATTQTEETTDAPPAEAAKPWYQFW